MKPDSKETLPDWPFPWPEDTIKEDWSRAALLVVDLQNYMCNPEVALTKKLREEDPEYELYYVPRTVKVLGNTKKLLHAFRMLKKEVVYTRHGPLLPDGRDMVARRQKRDGFDEEWVASGGSSFVGRDQGRQHLFSVGTFEHQILDSVAPQNGELTFDKNSSSLFNSTDAHQIFQNIGINTLVVVGGATDMCVTCTALDAADRGYNVIVVEDCTVTFAEDNHVNALSLMARCFTKVWSADQVLAALAASTAAPPSGGGAKL